MVALAATFLARVRARRDDEEGQTLVEYGLLLAFIAIVVIAAVILIGPTVSGVFQRVNDQI